MVSCSDTTCTTIAIFSRTRHLYDGQLSCCRSQDVSLTDLVVSCDYRPRCCSPLGHCWACWAAPSPHHLDLHCAGSWGLVKYWYVVCAGRWVILWSPTPGGGARCSLTQPTGWYNSALYARARTVTRSSEDHLPFLVVVLSCRFYYVDCNISGISCRIPPRKG